MGTVRFPEWWRRWRRFPFLVADIPRAVVGSWGPIIGDKGVVHVQTAVVGAGGEVNVSTYRGRPPNGDTLEEIATFNITQSEEGVLPWVAGEITVDSSSLPCRLVEVTGLPGHVGLQWDAILVGADFSASITILGFTPDQVHLRMVDDDAGHTDLRTAWSAR